jgi:hypothetical protein
LIYSSLRKALTRWEKATGIRQQASGLSFAETCGLKPSPTK